METKITNEGLTFTQIFEEWADKHSTIDPKADRAVLDLYKHYKEAVTKDPERFTLPLRMRSFITELKRKFKEYQEKKQITFYYDQKIKKEEKELRPKVRGLSLVQKFERRRLEANEPQVLEE